MTVLRVVLSLALAVLCVPALPVVGQSGAAKGEALEGCVAKSEALEGGVARGSAVEVGTAKAWAAKAASSETAQQLSKGWWGTPLETGAYSEVVFNNGSPEPVSLVPEYNAQVIREQIANPTRADLKGFPTEEAKLTSAELRKGDELSRQLGDELNPGEIIRAHDMERAVQAAKTAWGKVSAAQKRDVNAQLVATISLLEHVDFGRVEILDMGTFEPERTISINPLLKTWRVSASNHQSTPQWEISSFNLDSANTAVSGASGASAQNGALQLSEGTAQVKVPYSTSFAAKQASFSCSLNCLVTYTSRGYVCDRMVFSGVRYLLDGQEKEMLSIAALLPEDIAAALSSTAEQAREVAFSRSAQADLSVNLSVLKTGSYDYQMTMTPLFDGGALEASVPEQPYRLEADQKAAVLNCANRSVLEKANAAFSQVGVDPLPNNAVLFDDVTFVDSYASAGERGADLRIRLHRSAQADEAYSLVSVQDEARVAVQAVRDVRWKDSGLQLQGVAGEDLHTVEIEPGSWKRVWTKRNPVATLPGSQLAFLSAGLPIQEGQFSSDAVLNCGDGSCKASVWKRDSASLEVSRVVGVRYQMDSIAPVLLSAEVSAEGPGRKGAEFFGRDEVSVALRVADFEGETRSGEAFMSDAAASGVDKVFVSYKDSLLRKVVSVGSLEERDGVYRFSIPGDADVAASNISIRVIDQAGNVLETTGNATAGVDPAIARLVADAHAPRLKTTWTGPDLQNGCYSPGGRSLRVTIEEELFAYTKKHFNDQVIFSVRQDGKTVLTVHPSDFNQRDTNTWEYAVSFVHDGEYQVSAVVIHDVVGRSARAQGQCFVVDTKAPEVSVSFDNNDVRNGKYYAAARTATITVRERNFREDLVSVKPRSSAGRAKRLGQPEVSGWRSEGDSHVATVMFPGEGEYGLRVSGSDLALNAMNPYESESFVVDTVPPEISIDGLRHAAYTDAMDAASVQMSDANLNAKESEATVAKVTCNGLGAARNPYADELQARDDSETTVRVSFAAPEQKRANDGVYSLAAKAVDLAGNTAEQQLTWSVNRFGSTYLVMSGRELLGTCAKQAQDIHVLEINPSGIDVDSASVEVVHDLQAKTLERGTDYQVKQVKGAAWPTYRYEIPRSLFAADGEYQVMLHSQTLGTGQMNENADKRAKRLLKQSGNQFSLANSDAGISFAIDAAQPLVRFLNVQQGQFERASSFDAEVEIRDNMDLASAVVTIDGQDHQLTAEELRDSAVHRFKVSGKNGPQQLSVTAWDLAGNQSQPCSCAITVTDNLWYRIMHNAPLMAGTLGMLICVAAGLAAFMLRGRKQ